MSEDQNRGSRSFKPRLLRVAQVVVMLATVLLLVAHVAKWDAVRVDAVTLSLLGLLLVIPLAELIRKIRLGEFEAEIGRDEVARVQAKAAMELSPSPETTIGVSEERIRDLLRDDPRLALAKVRIELEEALKRLYSTSAASEPDWRRLSLSRLVDRLVRQEVLSGSVAGALREVIGLANRAVHGQRVESGAAEQLALLGVRLIRELQQLSIERVLRPVDTVVISPEEVEQYSSARFRVTTVIPLVEKPTRNTYVFTQEALDSFLEGYEEYAEFVVAIERA